VACLGIAAYGTLRQKKGKFDDQTWMNYSLIAQIATGCTLLGSMAYYDRKFDVSRLKKTEDQQEE